MPQHSSSLEVKNFKMRAKNSLVGKYILFETLINSHHDDCFAGPGNASRLKECTIYSSEKTLQEIKRDFATISDHGVHTGCLDRDLKSFQEAKL